MTDLITPEFIPGDKGGEKEKEYRRYDRSPWCQVPRTRYEPYLTALTFLVYGRFPELKLRVIRSAVPPALVGFKECGGM